MHNNTRVGPQVPDPVEQRLLQIKPLKIFGGIHIAFGLGITILSTIGVVIASGMEDTQCRQYNYGYGSYYYNCNSYKMLWLVFGATCLILSGWFIMTGALPFCMTETRITSWRCLKTAFMVCCILSAIIFGLTVMSLAVTVAAVESTYDYMYDKNTGIIIIFALLATIACCEVLLAIISASYCCCCSHLTTSNQTEMTTVESSLRTTASMPQMPHMPVHSGNPQGYPNMWLMPGQYGGQQVLYHVVGMSPAQGGFNHNTIYPSAPVLDQTLITQQQPNVYTEPPTTSNNS